ncbi:hypothetical protein CFP65_3627 [Kitasatospora sp. MMS16-BH015]|uniref:hypothetical protein n=1 Tax=Kitasatospora sp. MMS16-BH015 TaxID=2018025 RepID=UPI000CA17C43|nr:hypothetical protein [Kitasatospora sp. MMS16-BH015]AUG78416.1 hypothetical protein CFP65_3627 [Kitasatospora sp. MMS16-BH015]
MRTPEMNRSARSVAKSGKGGAWSRRRRVLTIAVPLTAAVVGTAAALAAQGNAAVAYQPAPVASSAAASVGQPSPVVPATVPSPRRSVAQPADVSASATPTLDPAPASTVPTAPTSAPAQPIAPRSGNLDIAFSGISAPQQVEAGGAAVSFAVTWTNGTDHAYPGISPVVSALPYDGAPCNYVLSMVTGTLQRRDGDRWTTLPALSQGGGMDYATTGASVAFALAPGASRTIEYRMHVNAGNRTGDLVLEADAYASDHPDAFKRLAAQQTHIAVTDHHSPTVRVLGDPTELVIGRTPGQFRFQVTAPTDSDANLVLPTMSVAVPGKADGKPFGRDNLTVEALVGGTWRPLPIKEDCYGQTSPDLSVLGSVLPAGGTATYTLRVGLVEGWKSGVVYTLGAGADGHPSKPVTLTPPLAVPTASVSPAPSSAPTGH